MEKYTKREPLKAIQREVVVQMPAPVPEAPRLVNLRPFVPDLSLTSESRSSFAVRPNSVNNCVNGDYGHFDRCALYLENPAKPKVTYAAVKQLPTEKHKTIYPRSRDEMITAHDVVPRLRKHSELPSKIKHFHFESPIRKNNAVSEQEIRQILRAQDEQLKRISQQIEELLRLQAVDDKTSKAKALTRSVETMTSIVCNDTPKRIELNGYKSSKKKGKRAPLKRNEIDENQSAEEARANAFNSREDDYYEKILMNISDSVNEVLRNSDSYSSFEDSDSVDSRYVTALKSRKNNAKLNYCSTQKHSEETLIINALASKYLFKEKENTEKVHTKRKLNNIRRDKCEFKAFDALEQNSIATRNYLEKYGLINDFKSKPRDQDLLQRRVVLDLEKLKKQPKLK